MQRTDFLEKTLMLGKIEGGRKNGITADEMVGWHRRLGGHEFEQAPGVGVMQSMGSQGVGHDWATELNLHLPRWCSGKESAYQCRRHKRSGFDPCIRKIPCSRKWQPTSVFLPGKFHGQWSLVGYNPWGHRESDMTEQMSTEHTHIIKYKPRSQLLVAISKCINLTYILKASIHRICIKTRWRASKERNFNTEFYTLLPLLWPGSSVHGIFQVRILE